MQILSDCMPGVRWLTYLFQKVKGNEVPENSGILIYVQFFMTHPYFEGDKVDDVGDAK